VVAKLGADIITCEFDVCWTVHHYDN
jgi:hypothetical protein